MHHQNTTLVGACARPDADSPAFLGGNAHWAPYDFALRDAICFIQPDDVPDRQSGLSRCHISAEWRLIYHEGANYARIERPKSANGWKGIDAQQDPGPVQELQLQMPFGPRAGTAKRGKVHQFSRRSRIRLLQLIASIAYRELIGRPLFITLTYPADWPVSEREWHRHLDNFRRELERHWGKAGTFWRLELQQRGAPHFHLLRYGDLPQSQLWRFRLWCSATWARIVGSGDPKHLAAGTRVEYVHSRNGAMYYAAKYSAKTGDAEGEYGRRWGVWNVGLLPIRRLVVHLAREGAMLVRRILWRMGQRGRKREGARARRRRQAAASWRAPPPRSVGAVWAFANGGVMEALECFLIKSDLAWFAD